MQPIPFPSPRPILDRFGLRPKKSFGQNFLCDVNTVERIAALVPSDAAVFEIGAGLGGLTCALLNRGHRVIAIERDRELIPVLADLFQEPIADGRLTVLEEDAKTVDYASYIADSQLGAKPLRWVLAGNLPYQITGPLLQLAVGLAPKLARAIFLVQLEVGERLASPANGEAYGALSVFTQAAFAVKRAIVVRRGAFLPQPNVDSAVITLDPLLPPRAVETPLFRALVKGAFHQRRKTLRNAWKGLPVPAEALLAAVEVAGISLDARGETLSVDDFARLALALQAHAAGTPTAAALAALEDDAY